MSENTSSDDPIDDQDSEPTLNAPEDQRPDGLDALTDDHSTGEDEDTAELPMSGEGTGDDMGGGLGGVPRPS
jgi:hypothetical protein